MTNDEYKVIIKSEDTHLRVTTSNDEYTRVLSSAEQGPPGISPYQVALNNGFVGTATEWIESLRGDSAYRVALNNGFVGTEEEWIESLKANINISPEVSGFILSNDGENVVWQTLENRLNNEQIVWDLGELDNDQTV